MNKSKCPHCHVKLGNYLYADACPHCRKELKHNTVPWIEASKKDLQKRRAWPMRTLLSIVRFVES